MGFVCPAVVLLQHQQQFCGGLLGYLLRGRGCDLSALLLMLDLFGFCTWEQV